MTELKHILPCAGFLLVIGACAGSAKQSASPQMREVAVAQERSQQNLAQAEEAQKDATKATERAAAAQAVVQRDQDKLSYDQQIARQEQAKAQQAQYRARQETQQATRETQQEQPKASRMLGAETQRVAKGVQTADGLVMQRRPGEVVIQPSNGNPMTFAISKTTKVRVEGRESSADRIQEGVEARVAYIPSRKGPMAISIVVEGANH
ncbi:MAG TPA: hypothetical protein VMK12_15575 [Anaeromyxobacteraceae bacterium]|nr:hypothetical protein [Anaeromyxobacteraceae bacterium]